MVDGWFTLNLISSTLVVDWFTVTWSQPPWLMVGSLKFDLDSLSRWLVYLNLISTVLVNGWVTVTWSQPPWLMAGSLKFDLDHLGRCLTHWNLISAVLVDGWFTLNLISSTFVDRRLTETWSRRPWSLAGALTLDLNLGCWLVHWNFISTVLLYGWFNETWSRLSWSMAGSHVTWYQALWLMAGSLKFDLDRFGL